MGKGFDTFMANPYWRKIYEQAPGEHLKEYYRIMFDTSPFVTGDGDPDEAAGARLKELWINAEELAYLRDHAGMPQAKAFYQRCIDTLAAAEEEGLCVAASCLKGEIRNPWYQE